MLNKSAEGVFVPVNSLKYLHGAVWGLLGCRDQRYPGKGVVGLWWWLAGLVGLSDGTYRRKTAHE